MANLSSHPTWFHQPLDAEAMVQDATDRRFLPPKNGDAGVSEIRQVHAGNGGIFYEAYRAMAEHLGFTPYTRPQLFLCLAPEGGARESNGAFIYHGTDRNDPGKILVCAKLAGQAAAKTTLGIVAHELGHALERKDETPEYRQALRLGKILRTLEKTRENRWINPVLYPLRCVLEGWRREHVSRMETRSDAVVFSVIGVDDLAEYQQILQDKHATLPVALPLDACGLAPAHPDPETRHLAATETGKHQERILLMRAGERER